MSNAPEDTGTPRGKSAGRPEPGSREARLADALRANLRRRKAAARKPAASPDAADAEAAKTSPESGDDSS